MKFNVPRHEFNLNISTGIVVRGQGILFRHLEQL